MRLMHQMQLLHLGASGFPRLTCADHCSFALTVSSLAFNSDSIVDSPDVYGMSPLMCASQKGYTR